MLALVLLVVVALVVTGVLLSTPAEHDLWVLNILVRVTDAGMFLAGAIASLLAVVAVILLRTGIQRSRARRRRAKALTPRTSSPAANAATPAATAAAAPPPATSVPAGTAAPSPATPDRSPDPHPGTRAAASTPAARPPVPASNLDLNEPEPTTNAAERQQLLAEADALTRDDPPR